MATSVTFGLIPLFTLPLMREGLASDSILFYRFVTATAALGLMMLLKKESFRVAWRDLLVIVPLAVFYTASSMFLLYGYEVMGAGVATTLHFTYPVFVTLLMLVLFRERASWVTWTAVVLAICGVAKAVAKRHRAEARPCGRGHSAALCRGICQLYNSGEQVAREGHAQPKAAFYVFVFTALIFGFKNGLEDGVQPLPDAWAAVNVVLLAVAPTVISNITLLLAVRNIGGTLTSILGALEPVTAVCIGALVFGEAFTLSEGVGIALILTAVVLVILNRSIKENLTLLLEARKAEAYVTPTTHPGKGLCMTLL